MATGDFVVFEEFAAQLGAENHIFTNGGDVFKVGIITNAAVEPTAATASPTWGDFSANQVAEFVGGYVTGGVTLANQAYTEAAGVATFDADDIALTQNASGFDDAYWAILYNDTNATDMAIGFVELGGPVSQIAGPIAINWNASGIFTTTVTP